VGVEVAVAPLPGPHIHDLPDDLILFIFEKHVKCDPLDMVKYMQVCRRWRDLCKNLDVWNIGSAPWEYVWDDDGESYHIEEQTYPDRFAKFRLICEYHFHENQEMDKVYAAEHREICLNNTKEFVWHVLQPLLLVLALLSVPASLVLAAYAADSAPTALAAAVCLCSGAVCATVHVLRIIYSGYPSDLSSRSRLSLLALTVLPAVSAALLVVRTAGVLVPYVVPAIVAVVVVGVMAWWCVAAAAVVVTVVLRSQFVPAGGLSICTATCVRAGKWWHCLS
jgi:hypothetical protein